MTRVSRCVLAFVAAASVVALIAQPFGVDANPQAQIRALEFQPTAKVGGAFTGIAVSGRWAYATRGIHFEVYDVGNPIAPFVVGSVDLPFSASVVGGAEGFAYLVTHQREGGTFVTRLHVVDVTHPESPRMRGTVFIGDDTALVDGMVVRGTWLYVAAQKAGLVVIDAADPDTPRKVGTVDLWGWSYGVAEAGGLLLAAIGQTVDGGLAVIETSDPARPTLLGRLNIGEYATGVCTAGGYALLISAYDIQVIDMSEPNNPRVLASTPVQWAETCASSGNWTYVLRHAAGRTDANHLQLLDTSALPALAPGDTFDLPSRQGSWLGTSLAVAGGYALVADVEMGLRVIGPADTATGDAVEWTRVRTLGEPSGVAIDGRYAYAVDYDDELWVLDLEDRALPQPVGRADLSLPGATTHAEYPGGGPVTVGGGYAYVARLPLDAGVNSAPGSVHVVDVRNPALPVQVGVWQPARSGGRPDLADLPITGRYPPLLAGDRLYVMGQPALTELDVARPDAPTLLRTFGDAYGTVGGGSLHAGQVWLATGTSGVEVVDLSDPTDIQRSRVLTTGGFANDVLVADDRVVVANGLAGLSLLDVESGTRLGTANALSSERVIRSEDTVFSFRYVAGAGGITDPSLWAIDIAEPSMPIVRGQYHLTHPFFPWTPPAALETAGEFVYLAEGPAGLGVFRLVEGATLPTPGPSPTRTAGPTRTPSPTGTIATRTATNTPHTHPSPNASWTAQPSALPSGTWSPAAPTPAQSPTPTGGTSGSVTTPPGGGDLPLFLPVAQGSARLHGLDASNPLHPQWNWTAVESDPPLPRLGWYWRHSATSVLRP